MSIGENMGGFYYRSQNGRRLYTYGFVDKATTEAKVAALADQHLVVDWNSHRYDDEGNVYWDVHEATPEEEGPDGAGGVGDGTPEAPSDEDAR